MSAGFFGKMPGHGDFVERGLPGGFKDTWDEWLQHSIASSKAALGDAWLDSYLTSPVWRFALAAGVCGANPWVGVLVPSVDRVGRYFPLTIASPIDGNTIPLQTMVASAEWHDRAQEAALSALHDDRVNADVLVQTLQTLDSCGVFGQPPIYCVPPDRDPREAMHAHALRMPFSYGTTPGHGLLAFSHRMLEAFFGLRHSVWWTHGSDRVQPGVFAAPMLPTPEAFAGMLSDQAIAPGWVSLPGYEMGAPLPSRQLPPEPAPAPAPVQHATPADSLIPDDDDTTLVPGLNQPPPAGAVPPQAPVPPSRPDQTPEQDPMLGEDPSPTSFDDLIVDAVTDDIESGGQQAAREQSTDFGLEGDTPPPLPSGEQPVPISSDEILAGFGGSPEPAESLDSADDTTLSGAGVSEEHQETVSADPFAIESEPTDEQADDAGALTSGLPAGMDDDASVTEEASGGDETSGDEASAASADEAAVQEPGDDDSAEEVRIEVSLEGSLGEKSSASSDETTDDAADDDPGSRKETRQ